MHTRILSDAAFLSLATESRNLEAEDSLWTGQLGAYDVTYDSLSCDMTISRDNDLLFSADMAEIVNAGTSKNIDPAQIVTDGNLGRFPIVSKESKLVKGCP